MMASGSSRRSAPTWTPGRSSCRTDSSCGTISSPPTTPARRVWRPPPPPPTASTGKHTAVTWPASWTPTRSRCDDLAGVDLSMARLGGTPRTLPDQPVATVDPEVERLAPVVVEGLDWEGAGEGKGGE